MIVRLSLQALWARRLTTGLTVVSIAISVALLLGVHQLREGIRTGFAQSVTGTDLIVGGRVGSLQLVLYTVFGIGSVSHDVSWESYQAWSDHPAVAWTVPLSLGDSHRGFRVVGTTEALFEHWRYGEDRRLELRQGRLFAGPFEVVVGHQVAQELGYEPGATLVLTHGTTGAGGISDHAEDPFTLVGVLRRTGTPVDRAVYVTLEGLEAIHRDWAEPAAADPTGTASSRPPARISAFLVGARSRMDTLRLQREIHEDPRAPLLAILPGVALSDLWRGLGTAEAGLQIVAVFALVVGLLGMLVALLTALEARRREMAILRSLGARPGQVVALLVTEATLVTTSGCLAGVVVLHGLMAALRPVLASLFGIALPWEPPGAEEAALLGVVLLAGAAMGLVPAVRAYRRALADGLATRF